MLRRAAIAVAVVALVALGAPRVWAAVTATTASCTSAPVVSDTGTGQRITVVCTVPKPPAVTKTVTVTATPTPDPTPSVEPPVTDTPAPTPTQSDTPAPPATPEPTPTSAPTVTPGDWPGPSNTGVPAGVTLRTVSNGNTGTGWKVENGTFYVTKAGTVIDGFDLPCLKVMANNVTIRNSRVTCSSWYAVNVSDPPTYYTGLTMVDSEIDGNGSLEIPTIAVMGNANATYLRLDIHSVGSSGPRMASGSLMQDSWVHGFVCKSGEHSAGSSANDGGSNIRWIHNNIDVRPVVGKNECASNALSIYLDGGGNYDGVQMIGNRLAGGAYGVYTLQNQGAKNIRVERNTFVRGSFVYGAAAQLSPGSNGNTFTGNVYDDGTPVN